MGRLTAAHRREAGQRAMDGVFVENRAGDDVTDGNACRARVDVGWRSNLLHECAAAINHGRRATEFLDATVSMLVWRCVDVLRV